LLPEEEEKIGAANVNKVEGKDLATPGSLRENRDEGEQKGRTEKESFEWNFLPRFPTRIYV